MAIPGFNGSGTYVRKYSWVADSANEIKILAPRHDEEDDGLAAALSLAICRDGQSQVISDIPFNGHKLTGVADPASPQDVATEKYVDDRFATVFTITGTDDAGRINFSGSQAPLATGKPLGLSFTQADLFFGVKPLDVESTGKQPRWVWNDKGDGMGTDVATMNDTGQLETKSAIYATSVIGARADTGNIHMYLLGPGDIERCLIYAPAEVNGSTVLRVNGAQQFTFGNDGSFHAPTQVFAAGAYLNTDGNIVGAVWGNWGYSDAYNAIGTQIESRASAARQCGC